MLENIPPRRLSEREFGRIIRLDDRWDQDDLRDLIGHIAWMELDAQAKEAKLRTLEEGRAALVALNQKYVQELTWREASANAGTGGPDLSKLPTQRVEGPYESGPRGFAPLDALDGSLLPSGREPRNNAMLYDEADLPMSRDDMEGHPQNSDRDLYRG